MNYADFYTSAEKVLIDSLVSLWLRGKAKEVAYMRHILSKEEPLMAEPVFQSIFPWENRLKHLVSMQQNCIYYPLLSWRLWGVTRLMRK